MYELVQRAGGGVTLVRENVIQIDDNILDGVSTGWAGDAQGGKDGHVLSLGKMRIEIITSRNGGVGRNHCQQLLDLLLAWAWVVRRPEAIELRCGDHKVEANQKGNPDKHVPLQAGDSRPLGDGNHALAKTLPLLLCILPSRLARLQAAPTQLLPACALSHILDELRESAFKKRARAALLKAMCEAQELLCDDCLATQVKRRWLLVSPVRSDL